jgi:hypothetical protein
MILFKHNGNIIYDYQDAYHYLRDKTPEDSRVMAWWDYGIFEISLIFFYSPFNYNKFYFINIS